MFRLTSKVKEEITSVNKELNSNKIAKKRVLELIKQQEKISKAATLLGIGFNTEIFSKKFAEIEFLEKDYNSFRNIGNWIQSHSVTISLLPELKELENIDDINARLQEFKNSLGIADQYLKMLKFFLPKKNLLFDIITSHFLEENKVHFLRRFIDL